MKHSGLTLVEILLVVAIIGLLSTFTIPLYREYQIRNDLNVARARVLSESSQNDTGWGFYVPAGVLYKGSSYAKRDPKFDELYAMPSTIKTAGLFEVSYSKIKGVPSATGSIILTTISNDQRSIQVDVLNRTIAVTQGDNLAICHLPGTPSEQTITVSDAAWPAHQAHGDYLGTCHGSISSAASSSSRSSNRSSSSASSAAGNGGGCSDRFSVATDGTITTTGPLSVIFQSMGAQFGYGNGGPTVPVTVAYQNPSKPTKWLNLFSGNAINGTGGATQTVTGFVNGNKVILQFHAYFNSRGWLTYDNTVTSNDTTGSVKILRNGDPAPTIPGSTGQQSVSSLLAPITVNGKINIGSYDLLMLADFNYNTCHTCAESDFQDGIVLVKFQPPSC
jgi:prepilin-type N-terminal cleavage/methylation domain-containing protein